MVAKRGLTNQANVHTPMWKKSLKAQQGKNPIDPAILAEIGHRFIAKKNKKNKNADARVWGDARGDQKRETFFCLPKGGDSGLKKHVVQSLDILLLKIVSYPGDCHFLSAPMCGDMVNPGVAISRVDVGWPGGRKVGTPIDRCINLSTPYGKTVPGDSIKGNIWKGLSLSTQNLKTHLTQKCTWQAGPGSVGCQIIFNPLKDMDGCQNYLNFN